MGHGRRLLIFSLLASTAVACVKFSPEVKATFEPPHPGEHSNFEPRHTAFTPIALPAAPPDAGTHGSQGALVMEGAPPSPPAVTVAGPPRAAEPASAAPATGKDTTGMDKGTR